MQPGHKHWDPGKPLEPNAHLRSIIIGSMTTIGYIGDLAVDADDITPRTELNSHANMVVVGCHATIVNETGKSVEVNPFSPDYNSMTVKLVDAVVRYDCPFEGTSQLILFRDALHVPSMQNNLIPPFIIREAGVQLYDTPKIHVNDPTVDDHSIYFDKADFRIPLQLWGIFSYFELV